MKIDGDEALNYRVYLDDELFSGPGKIIFSVDTIEETITYIFEKDHFPYWPSTACGKVRLEKINA